MGEMGRRWVEVEVESRGGLCFCGEESVKESRGAGAQMCCERVELIRAEARGRQCERGRGDMSGCGRGGRPKRLQLRRVMRVGQLGLQVHGEEHPLGRVAQLVFGGEQLNLLLTKPNHVFSPLAAHGPR